MWGCWERSRHSTCTSTSTCSHSKLRCQGTCTSSANFWKACWKLSQQGKSSMPTWSRHWMASWRSLGMTSLLATLDVRRPCFLEDVLIASQSCLSTGGGSQQVRKHGKISKEPGQGTSQCQARLEEKYGTGQLRSRNQQKDPEKRNQWSVSWAWWLSKNVVGPVWQSWLALWSWECSRCFWVMLGKKPTTCSQKRLEGSSRQRCEKETFWEGVPCPRLAQGSPLKKPAAKAKGGPDLIHHPSLKLGGGKNQSHIQHMPGGWSFALWKPDSFWAMKSKGPAQGKER